MVLKRVSDFAKVPDWMGTAVIGIFASMLGFAVMWGTLKSEVQAQGTAQAVDSSDIKQLIVGQASMVTAVKALTIGQEQLHQDFQSLMDTNSRSRNNSARLSQAGVP